MGQLPRAPAPQELFGVNVSGVRLRNPVLTVLGSQGVFVYLADVVTNIRRYEP